MGRFFFVPEYPLSDAAKARVKEAKRICQRCPVVAQCGNYARHHSLSGVWGGTLIAPLGAP
jgi:hypothetical protein